MSEKPLVIGITGLARSGKDTIASILCTKFGFTRIALADGVRSAFRDLDGPTWELTKGLEANDQTTRWALQTLGTECRVEAGCPKLWLDLLMAKIHYLSNWHPLLRTRFVIPDIRFFNEKNHLTFTVPKHLGGRFVTWKAIRDGSGLAGEAGKHSSETELSKIVAGVDIYNNGTLADLENNVSILTEDFLKGY